MQKKNYKQISNGKFIIILLKIELKKMKKMISQTNKQSVQKEYKNDYTDISTQNSSQHSVDSSYEQKSNQGNTYILQHNANQQGSYNKQIQEEQIIENDKEMIEEQKQNEKDRQIKYYKKCVEWLVKKYKRFRIKIDTLYLTISYIIKYMSKTCQLKYRYELLSGVCLLIGCKMNQINYPSIKSIINTLEAGVSKRQFMRIQQEILEILDYNIGISQNSYSIVNQYFRDENQQKRRNAQKLLYLGISNPQTLQFGQLYLGYSIVYLLKPQSLKQSLSKNGLDNNGLYVQEINRDKMKKIAYIVYNMYRQKKNQLINKQNCE